MRRELRRKARAKLNLGLDVCGRRPDGYHELRMVMQTIGLADDLTLQVREEKGVTLDMSVDPALLPGDGTPGWIPKEKDNLAFRAARLLMEEGGISCGLSITMKKKIPAAAGLAGGSADAAAVLEGVNDLFALGLSREALMERGRALGADVPYCLLGGTAYAEGTGEKLTPLPAAPPAYVVLAKPPELVSTKEVYRLLDQEETLEHPQIDSQVRAIRDGDFRGMAAAMGNVLEHVTAKQVPSVEELCRELRRLGAEGAGMSGSGPTVFGLFSGKERAGRACKELKKDPRVSFVYLTQFA